VVRSQLLETLVRLRRLEFGQFLGPEKKFQGSKEEADSVQRHEKLEKSFKKPRWCAAAAAADCAKS
jgi:hypothetical protein